MHPKKMRLTAVFLMLGTVVIAEDLSRYCPTITEIYGVCSPELVQNYLDHINDTYRKSDEVLQNESVTVAELSGTGQDRQDQNIVINSPATVESTPEAQKPIICFCAIDDSRRCFENGEYKIAEAYNEKCEVRRRKLLGLPELTPWYSDKMFMVS